MNCKKPNLIYFSDCDEDNKKRVHFIRVDKRNFSHEFYDEVIRSGAIEVPCGECVACRLDYSRQWANRCYLESLSHPFTWFITLSYRDDALVFGSKGLPTLEKDALSSFVKRLRKRLGNGIRFFGCGEYGDNTARPHYHLILFGPVLNDLTIDMPDMSKPMINGKYPTFRRKNGYEDYVMFSQTIYDAWKKGKIEVEEAGWNCAAYVSRYVVKKQKGKGKAIYDRLGIEPEYLRMSNRPGIGADWLIYNKNKILNYDYLSVKNRAGVQTSHPPRYFDKLMHKDEFSLDAQRADMNKLKRIDNAKKRFIERLSNKSVGSEAAEEAEFIEKKTKLLIRDIN